MRETGIVRRIDELGRVVIPKEIRKTQRIRTGDSLEIYTDGNGEVIFKKYSPLAELGEPAAVYADVLARRLRCAVAVCDREHIVAAAGAGKGELLGAPLPPEIEPLLTRRKLYTAPASAAEREPLGSRYLLCAAPILVHGDIEGGVLLHGTLREAAPNAETVRAAATAVSDWAADKRQYYEDTTTLKEENAALKKEIADLRAQQRQAQADSEENKLLRELLKLQQQRRDFTFVSTAVLAHSESSWTSSLSLNHGTDQDIAVGDCVVNAEGYLVGVISEVGLNWSTVLTVIDTDTELGARIFRTGEVAVAEGDFALMGQGKLKLSYLTSDDEVLIGDQIVTSGLGGYYPSGLVIGSVESLQTGDDGLARYAVLAPMMDFAALTEVFVITDYDIVD